ncbi:MAG: M23 family metallopeptidase [Chloroflexi bacterium]|nr:M23 family metallopeptidase [Chloroflexota bacterium]
MRLASQQPGEWRVDQDFQEPNPNFEDRLHLGEDWNWGYGDDDPGKPVFAVADGVVSFADEAGPAWGGVVVIKHTAPQGSSFTLPGWGLTESIASMYGHVNAARINEWVTEGDRVTAGKQIGVIGPTAQGSTAPHLHFEIRTNTIVQWGPGYEVSTDGWVDPSRFIEANSGG